MILLDSVARCPPYHLRFCLKIWKTSNLKTNDDNNNLFQRPNKHEYNTNRKLTDCKLYMYTLQEYYSRTVLIYNFWDSWDFFNSIFFQSFFSFFFIYCFPHFSLLFFHYLYFFIFFPSFFLLSLYFAVPRIILPLKDTKVNLAW